MEAFLFWAIITIIAILILAALSLAISLWIASVADTLVERWRANRHFGGV